MTIQYLTTRFAIDWDQVEEICISFSDTRKFFLQIHYLGSDAEADKYAVKVFRVVE